MEKKSARQNKHAGNEGDILKHSLLLDLLARLCPTKGEFWYLESHAGKGVYPISEGQTALRLWEQARANRSSSLWRSSWLALEDEALQQGSYLGSATLACRSLLSRSAPPTALRLVLAEGDRHELVAQTNHLHQDFDRYNLPQQLWQHPHRVWHLAGDGLAMLGDLAAFGLIRFPGLVLIDPFDPTTDIEATLSLLDVLLNHRLWVMLFVPVLQPPEGPFRGTTSSYQLFAHSVASFQCNGTIFWCDCPQPAPEKPHRFEIWVLTPERSVSWASSPEWEHLCLLFEEGLGYKTNPSPPQALSLGFRDLPSPSRSLLGADLKYQIPFSWGNISIDQAHPEDLLSLLLLWEELMDYHAHFDPHFKRNPNARQLLNNNLRNFLEDSDHLILVARHHEQVVAFLTAQIVRIPLFEEGRMGHISDVFVAPSHRRLGIGSVIVQLTKAWFQLHDLPRVDLNVAVYNPEGMAFWRSQGFRPYLAVHTAPLLAPLPPLLS